MRMKKKAIIYPNVSFGKKSRLDQDIILGYPPFEKKEGEIPLKIGDNIFIRSGSVIYAGSKIGNNFQCGHNVVIRENNIIGDNVMIHSNSQIYPYNKIDDNVVIHAGCFLESARLEKDVILGPGVVFIDDLHPRCPRYLECVGGAVISREAKIGANVTVLPGVKIGKNSLVGAGSVVTKDIPSGVVVVGNPAKVIKKISDLVCIKGFYKRVYEWEKK